MTSSAASPSDVALTETPLGQSAVNVVVVDVATHRLGLLAGTVVQIVRMVAMEPLPGAPEAVEGIIDRHGELVAVIDVRRRLGVGSRPPALSDHLVIVGTSRRTVALRVDRAVVLESHDLADVATVADAADAVRGVVRSAGGLLVVVDVEAFLSGEDDAALDAALAAVQGA